MINSKHFFILIVALFTFCGCNSNDDNGIDEEEPSTAVKDNSQFALRNYSHSGCKETYNAPKKVGSETPVYNTDEYIEYEGRENGYIIINHINTLFNCGLRKIGADISVDGDEILITEEMTEGIYARCGYCPFDVMLDAGPLTDGDYTVVIKKEGARYAKASITFSPTAKGKVNLEQIVDE